ncbi:hypothetical protein [Mycobacterium leprae]|uniref:hypothetical protein n=1 Tax=Mycobacterium leprae TaxID=1769 RepID=UPI000B1D1260|nr:hypothetical protein [Mycobacterium leprae]
MSQNSEEPTKVVTGVGYILALAAVLCAVARGAMRASTLGYLDGLSPRSFFACWGRTGAEPTSDGHLGGVRHRRGFLLDT